MSRPVVAALTVVVVLITVWVIVNSGMLPCIESGPFADVWWARC